MLILVLLSILASILYYIFKDKNWQPDSSKDIDYPREDEEEGLFNPEYALENLFRR